VLLESEHIEHYPYYDEFRSGATLAPFKLIASADGYNGKPKYLYKFLK